MCKTLDYYPCRMVGLLSGALGIMVLADSCRGEAEFVTGQLSQPSGLCLFDAFNPAMGMLNAVRVSVDGSAAITIDTPSDIILDGNSPVPVGYDFSYGIEEQVSGKMSLVPATRYQLTGQAPAASPDTTIPITYQYSFEFDKQSDESAGMALVSLAATTSGTIIPAACADAKVADFVGPAGTTVQFEFTDDFSPDNNETSTGPVVSFGSVTGSATLSIEYDYTVPEPGAFALVGMLLVGLSRRRAARRRASRTRNILFCSPSFQP